MPDMNLTRLPLAPRQPRIAIVATYDELCGIAGYARALERQLASVAEVTIFDLDQYLLRSTHKRIQKLADAHIHGIAAALHDFDSVNIQLEHGTLGRTNRQILRRFRHLAQAAPALSVTFHTVLLGEDMPWEVLSRLMMTGRFVTAGQVLNDIWRGGVMGRGLHGLLRRLQRKKPVSAIMHTRRDARMMHDLFGIDRVYHHPLSYMPQSAARALRARVRRADFPLLASLPADAKLIGTFGFLSPYKGFDTAIEALRHLPETHHLLIFGGLHPQGIKLEEKIAPYLRVCF